MNRISPPALVLLTAITAHSAVFAASDAHVHGIVELNIAIEGEELLIEFIAPADSIVGFEYVATTDAEKAAIAKAKSLLKKPQDLFDLPSGADCEVEQTKVSLRGLESDEHGHDDHGHDEHDEHAKDEHDDHGHEDHGHDDHDKDDHGHDDHGHDDHGHDDHGHDDHDHDKHEAHAEFRATYEFHCHGAAVSEIGLNLFEIWPAIEEVHAQALTPSGQSGGEYRARNAVIKLQ